MALSNALATIYSDKVLVQLEKALIYASPMVCNRDYEQEAANAKTVHLTGVYDPIVSSYTPDADMTADALTDFTSSLTLDQHDSYFFTVDDTQDVQSVPHLTPQALVRAAYKMGDAADKYVAALLAAAVAGTATDTNFTSPAAVGSTSAPSAISVAAFSDPSSPKSAIYEYLVDLGAALDEVAVPREDRYVILPPWAIADLNKDLRFTGYPGYGGNNTVLTDGFAASPGQNGLAGRVSGFNVIQSLNVPTGTFTTPTSSNPYENADGTSQTYYKVLAGVPSACTFANQILTHETFRDPRRFGWSHRGLHQYAGKVVWPERIVGAYIAKGA